MAKSIHSMFSLEGKVALITGASRGIGEEIASVYSMAGAKVVICSRKPEGVKEAVERINLLGTFPKIKVGFAYFLAYNCLKSTMRSN